MPARKFTTLLKRLTAIEAQDLLRQCLTILSPEEISEVLDEHVLDMSHREKLTCAAFSMAEKKVEEER